MLLKTIICFDLGVSVNNAILVYILMIIPRSRKLTTNVDISMDMDVFSCQTEKEMPNLYVTLTPPSE